MLGHVAYWGDRFPMEQQSDAMEMKVKLDDGLLIFGVAQLGLTLGELAPRVLKS